MERVISILSTTLILLTLFSCNSDSGSSSGSGGKKDPLGFTNLGHINEDNASSYSFGGSCVGSADEKINFSIRESVPDGGEPDENALVLKGQVNCTQEAWEVQDLDVAGPPDGELTVEISLGVASLKSTIIKDTQDPTMTLRELAEFVTEDRLRLSGTCDEDGLLSYRLVDAQNAILVKGEVSCTVDGGHSAEVSLSGPDGMLSVTAEFKDRVQNAAPPVTRSFTKDTTPPTITLEAPAINSHNLGAWPIGGDCSEEGREMRISINNEELSPRPSCDSSRWSAAPNISAATGTTVEITVDSDDQAGNSIQTIRQTIVRDVDAPALAGGDIEVPSDRTYSSGYLDFFVSFADNVVVAGSPRLTLTVGSDTYYANYRPGGSSASRLSFRYIILSGHSDSDGIGLANSIDLNAGSIRDDVGNDAAITPLSLPALTGIKVESNVPSLNSVAATTGHYGAGASVVLTATFGQAVTVTGTPRLVLDVGGVTAHANYDGDGSSSTTQTFLYTVAAGENDSDGIEVTAAHLAGGAIQNEANPPRGVLEQLGRNLLVSGVNVDTNTPVVIGLEDDSTSTRSVTWSWSCEDASNCQYRYAITTSNAHAFADEPYTEEAQAIQGSGDGVYYIHVQARDEAGNESAVVRAEAILDNTAPSQTGDVGVPHDRTYILGEELAFTVTFDEAVIVDITGERPALVFRLGGADVHALYKEGSGTVILTFAYTVLDGASDGDGLAGADIIDMGSGTMRDRAGNDVPDSVLNALRAPSLGSIFIDGVRPGLNQVTGSAATYKGDDTVVLTAVFNEPVIIDTSSGTPALNLTVGSAEVVAIYTGGGTSSPEHSFTYTVSAGENDPDGIEVRGIALNGGAIKDANGNDANVSPESALTIADIFVDTTLPVITGLSDDVTPTVSKTWTWGCDDVSLPCQYRHAITTSDSHTFANSDTYGTDTEDTQGSGDGTYYLHVQAVDSIGHESTVKTVSAVLDNSPPSITRVESPPPSIYLEGAVLDIILHFDEAVSIVIPPGVEDPSLILAVGANNRIASYYQSGSSGNALAFRYTVIQGDEDSDGIELPGAIALDLRVTIRNQLGLDAVKDIPTTDLSGVRVDARPPVITGVVNDLTPAKSKVWDWGCSDEFACEYRYAITSSDTHTFASELYTPTVQATKDSDTGTYYLHVQARDEGGNPSEPVTVSAILDNTAAVISRIDVPDDGTYGQGRSLDFVATFDGAVEVQGSPFIQLTIGITPQNAVYVEGGVTDSLTFRYTVQNGDLDSDGIEVATAINLNGGSIKDPAGNDAVVTGLSLSSPLTGVLVDEVLVVLSDVVAAAGFYRQGESIILAASFSEDVTVTGTPRLSLRVGTDETVRAVFSGTAGSASSSHEFTYTVGAGKNDADGIEVIGVAFEAGESIQAGGTDLEAFSGAISLSSVVVDTTVPATPTLSLSPTPPSDDRTPEIAVSGVVAGDIIALYQSGDCSGSSIVDQVAGAASETLTVTTLSVSGNYHFSVKAIDLAENESGCVAVDYELDTSLSERMVAAGYQHTCALSGNGVLKCWGRNNSGQLGLNDTDDRGDGLPLDTSTDPATAADEMGDHLDPVEFGTEDGTEMGAKLTAKAIAVGEYHSCALLSNGQVKCWGANDSGQLGLNDTNSRGDGLPLDASTDPATAADEMGNNLPKVYLGTGLSAKEITAGAAHTCALLSNDKLKCWGDGNYGQLGQGDNGDIGKSAESMQNLNEIDLGTVDGTVGGTELTVKAVSAGRSYTCALLSNDKLKCWGRGNSGQLGLGDTIHRGDGSGEMGNNLPAVNLGEGLTAKAVSAGTTHTCALLSDDKLKCWGSGTNGKLGQGNTDSIGHSGPGQIAAISGINLGTNLTAKAVAAGGNNTCALLNNDQLKCWGFFPVNGQGNSDEIGSVAGDIAAIGGIDLGTNLTAKMISLTNLHVCAILSDNNVKCWGLGFYGRLGQNSTGNIGSGANQMGDNLSAINLGSQFATDRLLY